MSKEKDIKEWFLSTLALIDTACGNSILIYMPHEYIFKMGKIADPTGYANLKLGAIKRARRKDRIEQRLGFIEKAKEWAVEQGWDFADCREDSFVCSKCGEVKDLKREFLKTLKELKVD